MRYPSGEGARGSWGEQRCSPDRLKAGLQRVPTLRGQRTCASVGVPRSRGVSGKEYCPGTSYPMLPSLRRNGLALPRASSLQFVQIRASAPHSSKPMQLTSADQRTLEKLRRSEALNKKLRWLSIPILLVLAALLISTILELTEFRERILNNDDSPAEIFAFGLPILYIRLTVLSCVTGLLLGLAIKNWNGNRTHQLIIGLVDALEKDEAGTNR